ncbi:F-box protein family-like [Rhynchospora pubera]|uniref:F-box protein family-like n=2 Tax=Rhynchospora pubera TaxID=906938 RepID=A0AAV8BT57_9POAL|nr:F-box protein family-like [Rhynchospora pubera]KAJ4746160.1 F-box protein family-like [Rhynchospora pubera]
MVACENEDVFPSNFFYQPWIIQCHGANKNTTTFIDPIKTNIEAKEIVEMQGKLCCGCIDEWIFLFDKQSKEYFFLDLNSLSKVHLPPIPTENIIFTIFSISTSPNHPDCTVILTGAILEEGTNEIMERVLMCCMIQGEKWNKVPLDEDFVAATGVILDGKFYMNNVGDVVVFDVLSLLAGQVDTRTIPTPMLVQHPRNDMVSVHLVESCGCIYLVRLYRYGGGPTIYMDIYLLDTSCDKWLRVGGIGERVFFLTDMSDISVCANDVGVECNCIYYASSYVEDEQRIYKFCLDDHTVAFTTIPTIEETERESRFCWFVPTGSQRMIRDSSVSPTRVLSVATGDREAMEKKIIINQSFSQASEDKEVMEKEIAMNVSRPWNDIPLDLLELLLTHLSLVDSLRLFTVCKSWNLASDSIHKAKTWPWLMYQEKLDGTCKLLDPFTGKEYTTRVGLPSSVFPTQMLCSKDGWVIILDAANTMLMVNPLNQYVVKLPFLEEFDEGLCGITFTSVPTSPDCVVLGFCTNGDDSIDFYKWQSGEENWTIIFDDESHFSAASTNPIFFREELYCLGESGELGVFNPAEETWEVLDKPEPVYMEDEVPFRGTQDCYLLELGGDLVSVFKYNYSDFKIRVFKLDKLKMEWIPVEELAGWTLFLDPRSSFAKPAPHKSWSNKIFFTTFHSSSTKTCASYCMESKRYDINFCDTKKPFDCVWLQPNLIGKKLMDVPCS